MEFTKFKIFEVKEKKWIDGYTTFTDEDGYLTEIECNRLKTEKPTLKGALGWRNRNQKFDGQYDIIPCY